MQVNYWVSRLPEIAAERFNFSKFWLRSDFGANLLFFILTIHVKWTYGE